LSGIDAGRGRIKEAIGALTGNEKLKSEGRADQVSAKVKEAVKAVKGRVADSLHED